MTPNRDGGIIDTPSNHSVEETVEKLKGILQAIEEGRSDPPGPWTASR